MVKINEEHLRAIIRESVQKALEEQEKGLLMEMPYPRNVYKEKMDAELPQVLTNWCLVRYRTITGTEQYKKHWKGKVRGHMYTMARFSLKGNDSIDTRRKILYEILNDNDYDDPKYLNLTVCNKFIEEQIDIKSREYETCLIDCINSLNQIFETILSRDIETINQYVETI